MKKGLWSALFALGCGFLWVTSPPAASPAALGGTLAFLLIEPLLAVPLEFGYFSLAAPLAYVLACWPGVGGSWAALALCLTLLVRAFARPTRSPGQKWAEWLCDALPALAAVLVASRWGWLAGLPILVLAAIPLTTVLRQQLGPAGKVEDFAALNGEVFSLVCLAAVALHIQGPAVCLALPVAWGLRRSALSGRAIGHYQAARGEVRQERRHLRQEQVKVDLTADEQAVRERQLNARAQAFLLLEQLSAQGSTPEQILQQIGQQLSVRFPDYAVVVIWQDQIRYQSGPHTPDRNSAERVMRNGQPLLVEDQSYWPLGSGLVWLGWRQAPGQEVVHSLHTLLSYAWALLERAATQQNLVQALQSEVGLRHQLGESVEQLHQLLRAGQQLNDLRRPSEVLELCVQVATTLASRACRVVEQPVDGGLPLGEWGWLELAPQGPQPVSPALRGALEVWTQMTENTLRRNQALAQLTEAGKFAAIGQLAAGVSHELNTPLGALTLALDVAAKSVDSRPERAISRIQQSQKAVESMQQIVSKLLYYARETGQGRRRVELTTLIDDALNMVEHSWQGLSVHIERRIEPVTVSVDPGEIHQILVNLLINAGHALRQTAAPHRLHIRLAAHQDAALLEIEDSGPGVDPAIAERIFEPFFTTRAVSQGTGLGLSISRQIAQAHGGTLEYRETPGPGACFRLRLPL